MGGGEMTGYFLGGGATSFVSLSLVHVVVDIKQGKKDLKFHEISPCHDFL